MVAWGMKTIDYRFEDSTNPHRYASEYHVERYLRECFATRLVPVSRVSDIASVHVPTDRVQEMIMNYVSFSLVPKLRIKI